MLEVLVAVAILAGLGVSVFDLISASFSDSVRAERSQAAPRVLTRVIDDLVARGFTALAPMVGSTREFSWTEEGDLVMDGVPVTSAGADAAGSPVATRVGLTTATAGNGTENARRITGSYRVDLAVTGLLRIAVTVRWIDARAGQPHDASSLLAFRYLTDPGLGMSSGPRARTGEGP